MHIAQFLSTAAFVAMTSACANPVNAQTPTASPHLERRGRATQLMVDGKPLLILGGELHNSSASSLAYMETVWPRLTQQNLNTVLAAVSWGEIEPAEGRFNFTVVDGLLQRARKNNLRLVLLWFGSWKNGLSHYARRMARVTPCS